MEVKRERYLNELIERINTPQIKVITGIRRCGKSYLLNKLFRDYLIANGTREDHIISVSLDNLQTLQFHDPFKLDKHIRDQIVDDGHYFIFLDEIQEVDKFVYLLNGLMQISNVDVYVTGSNSRFLSKDVITEFRGRGDQIHIRPLSFKEYYEAVNQDFDFALDSYLTYGGLPHVATLDKAERKKAYLENLYYEIYLRDIKERYGIRNDSELSELLNVVSSSTGSLTSLTKLSNTFRSVKNVSISKNTIASYLHYFEDSFLVEPTERYDIKGKRYIDSPRKYYFTDLGLRNARLNFRENEEPHLMENLIYNEIRIRNFSVDVGVVFVNEKNQNGNYVRKQTEVDFVCNRGDERYYIQSAYRIPTFEKEKQEVRPLENIPDSFKKIVIVRDNIGLRRDNRGVVTMSLKQFLLDENALSL